MTCNRLMEMSAMEVCTWRVSVSYTHLRLSSEGSLSYIAMQEGKTVLDWAALGMETSVADFSTGLEYSGVSEIKQIDETYTVPSRKKAEYVNRAQERTISFTKDGVPFEMCIRDRRNLCASAVIPSFPESEGALL